MVADANPKFTIMHLVVPVRLQETGVNVGVAQSMSFKSEQKDEVQCRHEVGNDLGGDYYLLAFVEAIEVLSGFS